MRVGNPHISVASCNIEVSFSFKPNADVLVAGKFFILIFSDPGSFNQVVSDQ